jgi:charged multivesicular body protein 6
MGFLFCKKSRVEKLNQHEQAVFDCKCTRDKLKVYLKSLEKNEQKHKNKAKEFLREKNRDRARVALNQSKLYRTQIDVASGQLNMIEEQIIIIEGAVNLNEAAKVLENGNSVLKKLQEEVNVEKWERIAEDMDDLKEKQNEISDFLQNHNISQTEFDKDVDNELEKLMKLDNINLNDELPETKLEIKKEEELPSVPKEKKEEKEDNKNIEDENQPIAMEN